MASATGPAQASESSLVRDGRSTTELHRQPINLCIYRRVISFHIVVY